MKSFKFIVALSLARRIQRRHGLAALTVVMILFFVMAMVAAYTNRNLIFEQRIATNSYRGQRQRRRWLRRCLGRYFRQPGLPRVRQSRGRAQLHLPHGGC